MTSYAVSSLRIALATLAGLALLCAAFFAAQPASAAMKGSMVAYNTSLEQKKCKSRKGKAKATCLRQAKSKGASRTARMMSTEQGLYGYGIPAAAIPGRNGTLVWSKQLATTPGAARTDFVLYSSRSVPGNRKIVVSGTVSVPEGTPPAGGWPVISWAHGTVGLADKCAPSKGGDQGSYGGAEPLVESWLEDGYAVVATDYEGLGTPGIHPYLQGDSQAYGVLDIVRASRTVDPRISKRVVIAGHSQGGHAALFAAKNAPDWSADINHLGTVPYAPPADFQLQGAGIGALPNDAYGIAALATSILRGAVASDPSIDASAILTEEAYQHWGKVDTMCLGELGDEFAATETGPRDLLRPGVLFQPAGAGFSAVLAEMEPVIRTNRPVLIVQGRQDTTVLPGLTDTLVDRLRVRNPGVQIDYYVYGNAGIVDIVTPGASTHGSVLADADDEVDEALLDWYFPT